MWSFYKEKLTPSLSAKVAKRNAQQKHEPPPPSLSQTLSFGMFQTDELAAAKARHHGSPKGFACFLSHHKQACAAEARVVKQQLESMLDAKVFLGKCSTTSFSPPEHSTHLHALISL